MRPGQVIGQLIGVRVKRAYDVPANRLKAGTLGKIDGREALSVLVYGWNRGPIGEQSQLRQRLLTPDGKAGRKKRSREAIPEFAQQVIGEHVVMRNQEAAVMLGIHIVRQQRI